MIFIPRLSPEGISEIRHYTDNAYCAFNGTPNAMPNCTAYAFSRSSEIGRDVNIRNYSLFNRKGADFAQFWYPSTLWKKGPEPRLGAIACWDGNPGHVAIVEAINSDGSIKVSQSNYGGTFWEIKDYNLVVGEATKGVGLVFQGYIYNPNTRDARTERDPGKAQVEVIADRLRARSTPNGDIYGGCYMMQGTYDVIETSTRGAYTWARIDDNVWIALNEGTWTRYYPTGSGTEGSFDELVIQLNECLTDIKRLKEELKAKKERYLAIAEDMEREING